MSGVITAERLRRLNPVLPGEKARLSAAVLDAIVDLAELTTPRRVCHFLAQVMQETGGLRGLIESTRYTDPVRLDAIFRNVQGVAHAKRLIAAGPEAIGNTIYANKNGNGGVGTGDGFRFRGRGYLQVTGRANYRDIGKLVAMPLEASPETLGEPEPAARAAATYWRMRKINIAADADDIGTVTFLVNGPARLHLKERGVWFRTARTIWTG